MYEKKKEIIYRYLYNTEKGKSMKRNDKKLLQKISKEKSKEKKQQVSKDNTLI